MAAGHVTVNCTHGKKRNVFIRDLKDPSESLSITVRDKAFQVCGAEKRKARLAKSVRKNGSDVVERRDGALSLVLMWWLGYVGIEVMRTLNVRTVNLYVIRRWTGSQCSWRSSDLVSDCLGA